MKQRAYGKRAARVLGALGATAALALTGIVAVQPIGNAAPTSEWKTSFEEGGDPAVDGGQYSAPVNFAGDRTLPGSLLRKVTDISASGDNPPNETKEMLADADASTKWLVFAKENQWVSYTFDEPVTVSRYTMTSGGDAPGRDPKTFRVEASHDGESWQTIDEQDDATWSGRGVTNEYVLDAPSESYKYWRLYVVANSGDPIIQLADWELFTPSDGTIEASDLALEPATGPTAALNAKTRVGFTGMKSAKYSGRHLGEGPAQSEVFIQRDINTVIGADTELSYKVFPVLDALLDDASAHVGVDLEFEDGSRLSELGLQDSYGYQADARSWGSSKLLVPAEWNSIKVDLSSQQGKVIRHVIFVYDNDSGSSDSTVQGWIDDVSIAAAQRLDRDDPDGLVSFVDTRRGTNASGGYSRGLNIPAVSLPNGFNFITPMTQGTSSGELYKYHKDNDANNRPSLAAIGISHEPSIWMGDRNQLAVMPSLETDPSANVSSRRLSFSHDNEVARPDLYQVAFDNGLKARVAPEDHAVVYQFDFGTDSGSIIVDQVAGNADEAKIKIDEQAGIVSGWVDHGSNLSAGRSRMFVYGTFSQPVSSSTEGVGRPNSVTASFVDLPDNTVELRLATSFISLDQARKNLELEVQDVSFDQVKAKATSAWNDRLSVVQINSDATDHELITFYSNLYRLNMYPNSQHENVGTNDDPQWRHASPVAAKSGSATDTQTNASVIDGKMYVNNGFWDTYRTAWPLYSLLYPDVVGELIDGFVQQYREGGWISRWSSPGYANLMTGTSSDVSFAEAYATGALDSELALEAYQAGVRNATVLPVKSEHVSDAAAVGRKGIDTGIFLGYTSSSTGQSVSWGMEGFINDFGLSHMASKLAEDPAIIEGHPELVDQLKEEASYFQNRSLDYVNMFNPEVRLPNPLGDDLRGAFASRNASGAFEQKENFDIKDWGGAYTEGSGWTFAYHAFYDVEGMAALYSKANGYETTSNEALLATLDAFFGQPDWHSTNNSSGIHEAREARDIRIGMLGISNQIAYHIPYIYSAAGRPSSTQEIVREILQRVFQGADIGQGYIGDEDNGAYSSWYVFSALGFYPRQVGTGDYTIGSPLFDSVTLWPGSERELTINATGSHAGNIYVAGVNANGTELSDTTLPGDSVRNGGTINFSMSGEPTSWGQREINAGVPVPAKDVSGADMGTLSAADGTAVGQLIDNSSRSSVTFGSSEATLTWESKIGPIIVDGYSLTNSTGNNPNAWTLAGSNDGGNTWTEVDSRDAEAFKWQTQTRPFTVDGDNAKPYQSYRLSLTSDAEDFTLAEIELFGKSAAGDLTVSPASELSAQTNEEISSSLATISGGSGNFTAAVSSPGVDDLPATVIESNGVGGWKVTVPGLSFVDPGVYDISIVVTDNADQSVGQATTRIRVTRNDTFAGSFNNVCITDIGAGQADCDGQQWQFGREDLVQAGYRAGETVEINGLKFDLPAPEPGKPDHVTDEGQEVFLDIPVGATQLSLLGTGTESKQGGVVTLVYSDGTTQPYPIEFLDWVGGAQTEKALFQVPGRYRGTSATHDGKRSAFYASEPLTLLGSNSAGEPIYPVKLVLPQSPNGDYVRGRMHIFAYGTDAEPNAVIPLQLEALETPAAIAGEETTFDLARAEGGLLGNGIGKASINWGDGSAPLVVDLKDNDGELVVSGTHVYTVPGEHSVAITVDDGRTSKSLDVVVTVDEPTEPEYSPQIAPPTSVLVGEAFTLEGSGFAPNEQVAVTIGTGERKVQAETTTDGEGNLSISDIVIPTDWDEGTYPVVAVGAVSANPATGSLVVTVPAVYSPQISAPAVVTAGDSFAVDGLGFAPGENITVGLVAGSTAFGANGDPIVSSGVTADENGNFTGLQLVTPENLEPGDYLVVATGSQSQVPATSGISVKKAGGNEEPGGPVGPGDGNGSANGDNDTNGANKDKNGSKSPGALSNTGAAIAVVAALAAIATGLGVFALRRRAGVDQ